MLPEPTGTKPDAMIPGLLPASHDPGGKSFALPAGVIGSAVFGGDLDCYRYLLTREWSTSGLTAMVLMMNPSCADPLRDDRTIQGITRKVRQWNGGAYGRFVVCNTFAYRAKDQERLAEVADPVGPENDCHILDQAARSDIIVFAYGKPKIKSLRARGPAVASMLQAAGHDLFALKVDAEGTPGHPLYLKDDTVPMLWRKGATSR